MCRGHIEAEDSALEGFDASPQPLLQTRPRAAFFRSDPVSARQ
jgi:hypothetical protein